MRKGCRLDSQSVLRSMVKPPEKQTFRLKGGSEGRRATIVAIRINDSMSKQWEQWEKNLRDVQSFADKFGYLPGKKDN